MADPLKTARSKLSVALVSVLLFCTSGNARQFYITTNGDDTNPGTQSKPFATLERARDSIRALRKAGPMEGETDVIIGGGTYFLGKSFLLTTEDSGTLGAPVKYKAADGEHVFISGGRLINGRWKTDDGKVFYLDLPEAKNGKWKFKQLFVDGRRAVWARFPNGNATIKVIKDGEDNYTLHCEPGAAKPAWMETSNALLNIVAEHRWFNELVEIESVSPDGSTIKIKGGETQGKILDGNYFFVEGLKAELDQPDEWFLDAQAGRLYYWPPNGDPSKLRIVAPALDRLVELDGDRDGPSRIQYVTLQGFSFTDLDYTVGHLAVRTTQDSAIRLMNAFHCSVEDCKFNNIGGYGVWLHLDCQFNRVVGNEIFEMGSGGVLLTSARFAYATDDMIYDPDRAVAGFAPLRNEISRNTIHNGGLIRRYCSGVHLDSRPVGTALDAGNLVDHNHIFNMGRNGIFAFRNQGGNIFAYNHIHDVMQVVEDGGAIHVATMNPLAAPIIIRGNYIHNIGFSGKLLANGIYPDWFSSHLRVENNIVVQTCRGAFKMLGGDDNLFVNNIAMNDSLVAIEGLFFGVNHLTGDRFERNIILSNRADAQGVGIFANGFHSREEVTANPQLFAAMNHNLYWNTAGPTMFYINGKDKAGLLDFNQWRATGIDEGSLEGDPMFAAPEKGNFTPRLGSPAGKIGFVPIDMSLIGPQGAVASAASFDELQRDAVVLEDEDKDDVETRGSCSFEHVVLAGQAHTFLTQLALPPSASDPGYIRFEPRVKQSGEYELWVRWFPSQQTHSTKTSIVCHTGNGDQRLVLDQTKEAIKWLKLGTYHFAAGDDVNITFGNEGADGLVVAKAVALVKTK